MLPMSTVESMRGRPRPVESMRGRVGSYDWDRSNLGSGAAAAPPSRLSVELSMGQEEGGEAVPDRGTGSKRVSVRARVVRRVGLSSPGKLVFGGKERERGRERPLVPLSPAPALLLVGSSRARRLQHTHTHKERVCRGGERRERRFSVCGGGGRLGG